MDDTQPPAGVSSAPPSAIELVGMAFRFHAPSPGAKFTLVALMAEMGLVVYDEVTGDAVWWYECSPGRDRLATATQQHDRTVRGHLSALEADGVIVREERFGPEGGQQRTSYVMYADNVRTLQGGVGVTPRGVGPTEALKSSQEPSTQQLAAPRGVGVTPTPPRPARARNPVWDAVVEVCGLDGARMTRSEASYIGKTVGELRRVEATPDQIREFARWWRQTYPSVRLTPGTITKHWSARGSVTAGGNRTDAEVRSAWMYQ